MLTVLSLSSLPTYPSVNKSLIVLSFTFLKNQWLQPLLLLTLHVFSKVSQLHRTTKTQRFLLWTSRSSQKLNYDVQFRVSKEGAKQSVFTLLNKSKIRINFNTHDRSLPFNDRRKSTGVHHESSPPGVSRLKGVSTLYTSLLLGLVDMTHRFSTILMKINRYFCKGCGRLGEVYLTMVQSTKRCYYLVFPYLIMGTRPSFGVSFVFWGCALPARSAKGLLSASQESLCSSKTVTGGGLPMWLPQLPCELHPLSRCGVYRAYDPAVARGHIS